MRSAARKFARPLANALALASQTLKERAFGGNGRSAYNPSVVIEMYVHDAIYDDGTRQNADGEPSSIDSRAGRLLLGANATQIERTRVERLLLQLVEYVVAINQHVRLFMCAAEELMNAPVEN
eukprot:556724-Prymnesium_polylepis.1